MIASSLRSALLAHMYLAAGPVTIADIAADPFIAISAVELQPTMDALVAETPAIVVFQPSPDPAQPGHYMVATFSYQSVPGLTGDENTWLAALAASIGVTVNELEILLHSFRSGGDTAGRLSHDLAITAAVGHVVASRLPATNSATSVIPSLLRVSRIAERLIAAGL